MEKLMENIRKELSPFLKIYGNSAEIRLNTICLKLQPLLQGNGEGANPVSIAGVPVFLGQKNASKKIVSMGQTAPDYYPLLIRKWIDVSEDGKVTVTLTDDLDILFWPTDLAFWLCQGFSYAERSGAIPTNCTGFEISVYTTQFWRRIERGVMPLFEPIAEKIISRIPMQWRDVYVRHENHNFISVLQPLPLCEYVKKSFNDSLWLWLRLMVSEISGFTEKRLTFCPMVWSGCIPLGIINKNGLTTSLVLTE